MSEIKNPANAAASAARRQDATAKAHDEARTAVKDLLDRRGNGEPPTTLRKRKGVYGCDIMRDRRNCALNDTSFPSLIPLPL